MNGQGLRDLGVFVKKKRVKRLCNAIYTPFLNLEMTFLMTRRADEVIRGWRLTFLAGHFLHRLRVVRRRF